MSETIYPIADDIGFAVCDDNSDFRVDVFPPAPVGEFPFAYITVTETCLDGDNALKIARLLTVAADLAFKLDAAAGAAR